MEECEECKEERPKIIVLPPFEFEPPNILRRDGKIVKNVWRDGKTATQEQVDRFIGIMEGGLDFVRKIIE